MGTLKKIWSPIILLLLVFLPHITCTSSTGDCVYTTCGGADNVEIRFPFRLKDRQHEHCGYPGFELSCTKNNETVLDLPFAGKFFVRNIKYISTTIEIYDPASCLPKRVLDFNLSVDSPFKGGAHRNYTFFNCSKDFSGYHFKTISCLNSSSSTHSYISSIPSEDTLVRVPTGDCNLLGTVSVPVRFVNYDESLDDRLFLTWDKPGCKHCELEGGKCGFKNYTTSLSIECFRIPLPPPPPHHKTKGALSKNMAIGLSIGFFVFLVATLIVIKAHKQTDTEEKENQLKIEKFLENYKALKPTRYSYADIKRITKKFKSKLGQGGYGSVFEGKLTNGIPVAVKILDNSKGNGEEFINEVGTIGRIHHVNVVRLLGFCADGSKRALIYEFMPNKSLDRFIFSRKDKNPYLGLKKLQEIAIGIARGIEYLHQGCNQRILHFDIKPHNILLDQNFNPKISDFGLAKLSSKGNSIVSMTAARGTMGYIAPEVFSRNFGNVSYKSDVYSFGMLLLEMVGGRKNIEVKMEKASQVYFPEWIYYRLDKGEDLGIQVDTKEDATIAKKLIMVALWCIQWHPVDRPSMKSVAQMLEGNTENLIMPPNPFASIAPATLTTTIHLEKKQESEVTVILEESK